MDVDDERGFVRVLCTTRGLRRLKRDQVSEELLVQLVDAAIQAPNGQNAQDWRFIVVAGAALKPTMQGAATA